MFLRESFADLASDDPGFFLAHHQAVLIYEKLHDMVKRTKRDDAK